MSTNKQLIPSLTSWSNNDKIICANDYVSNLKMMADEQLKDVEYSYESISSPRHQPLFRCKCVFKSHIVFATGVGKKIPKQHAAQKMLLLLSGDVETNPGPDTCYVYKREKSLREKIASMERARQRQKERAKTIRRQMRILKRDAKFMFQMNTIVDDVKKLVASPTLWRSAGYAAANLVAPGTGTAAATVIEGSKISNNLDSVGKSIDDLADTCSTQIPAAFAAHTNLTQIATMTLDTINQTMTRISADDGLLGKLEKLVGNLTSIISPTTLLISVLVILICLTLDWKIAAAVVVMVLCYFKWPQDVVERVKRIVFGWKFESDYSPNIFSTIGQVIFTLLAFFGVSQVPADKFYDNIIKRLDSIPKAFSGASKIWDAAGKTFEFVMDEFKVFFLGVKREDLCRERGIVNEVQQWVERVRFYSDVREKNLLAKEGEHVREVEQLYMQMYRWKHTTSLWKSLPIDCQRIIASLGPTMSELYKFACRSTVHEGGPRKAPLGVFLSGDSGRGKSELLYPLGFSLLASRNYDLKNAKNEIYVRNYETEYWDSYVGQKIVFFDDAFQMKDTPGNPSPEWMEAIRLLNTAPAHIHCADLNDKGRFFSSEICIYTSNLSCNLRNFITSVNCPEAAIRRLNVNAYRILTNPAFEREITVEGQTVRRLDKDKIRNCQLCEDLRIKKNFEQKMPFCPHVQMFQKYDIFTDEVLAKNISYAELVKQLKEYDSELCQNEERKLSMFEQLVADPFMFEANLPDDGFEDARDYVEHGAIDLSVPTDVVAYQTLVTYLQHLMTFTGINEDQVLADLAAHPQLFATYQRRLHCGIRNVDCANNSLSVAHEAAGIHFDHDASIYHSYRNLRYTWRNVYDSFCEYAARLGDQLCWLWNNSGIDETVSLIYLGLNMLALSGLAYQAFTNHACSYCGQMRCECIRWTPDGFLFMDEIYSLEADAMGDVKLTEQACVVPEAAASSGAPQVQTQRAFKVETNSSGNPNLKTVSMKYQQKFKLETDSSANPNVKTPASFKVEMYQDEACHDLETFISRKCLYAIHNGTTNFGNVLFVQGTTFLMNYHYVALFEARYERKMRLYLANLSGNLIEFTVGDILDNYVQLEKNGRKADAVLVHLDNKKTRCFPHSSIIRHFVQTSDLVNLVGKYNAQIPSFAGSKPGDLRLNLRSIVDTRMHENELHDIHLDDIPGKPIHMQVNHTWTYFGSTNAGDCGAPVIINNNFCSRKIPGIHMGARVTSNGNQGLAQTITQEMLNNALKKVPFECQCYTELDLPIFEIPIDEVTSGSVPLNEGLYVHGTTEKHTKTGGGTKIIPSPLYGLFEPKTMPTSLRPINGIDPMNKGVKKFGKEVPLIDPELLEPCIADVANNLVLNVTRRDIAKYKRVLTYEEAVIGVPEDEFLAPINRSTSMGFPYVFDHSDLRGKRRAFGDDEWTLDSELALKVKEDVDFLEQKCKLGIQTNVYWSDTLKDERRPIEKVQAGKTRVFCGGPVHMTILFRMYFLGFAAWIMHNRNSNEISTGTNVYSEDWSEIVRKLASRGRSGKKVNVAAGDFGNFDGSLSSQVLWHMLDLINEWYDDGPENARIRHTLWMHIVHAIHINGNVVYQCTHSQPSGCPITAILNSIYNSIVIRVVYLICARDYGLQTGDYSFANMEKFNRYCACVSYGDDNIIAIADSILVWFNQVKITAAFLTIGHEYTDEAKSGVIVPIRDISEIAYLKRKFVWDELANRYIAPLDLDVVLEIFQWTKKGLAADSITEANIDVSLRELCLHGKEVFDKYCQMLKRECIKKGIAYRFYSYQEYKDKVLELPFSHESNDDSPYVIELTTRNISKNYIFQDYSKRKLLIRKFDVDVIVPKIMLFCQYRNIKVASCNIPEIADKLKF